MKSGFVCGAVSGIMGAVLGGVSVYIYMKNVYEKQLDERIAEYTKSKEPAADKDTKEADDEEKKSEDKKDDIPRYVVRSSIDGGPVETEKTEYHKMAKNYMKTEADLENEHPDDEDDISSDEPFAFIGIEKYEDDLDYDKKEWEWYVQDDVIIDSFGDEVDDRDILTGELLNEELRVDILNDPVELDCCMIRNKHIKCDYFIHIITDTTYSESLETGSVK